MDATTRVNADSVSPPSRRNWFRFSLVTQWGYCLFQQSSDTSNVTLRPQNEGARKIDPLHRRKSPIFFFRVRKLR